MATKINPIEKKYKAKTKEVEKLERQLRDLVGPTGKASDKYANKRNYELAINKLRRKYGVKNITGDLSTVLAKKKKEQAELLEELSNPYVKRGIARLGEYLIGDTGQRITPRFSAEGGADYKLNPYYMPGYDPKSEVSLANQRALEAGAVERSEGANNLPFTRNNAETQTIVNKSDTSNTASSIKIQNNDETGAKTIPNEGTDNQADKLRIRSDVHTIDPRTGEAVGVLTRSQRKAFEADPKVRAALLKAQAANELRIYKRKGKTIWTAGG